MSVSQTKKHAAKRRPGAVTQQAVETDAPAPRIRPQLSLPPGWVGLAEVARPHGVRGELRLRLYNPDSNALLELDEVLIALPDGEQHEVSVDGARRADDAVLMKLYSVDDRDRAEDLRGAVIAGRREDFPALEPGEFYVCDIEGASVVLDDAAGRSTSNVKGAVYGVAEGLRSYPSVDVLLIRRGSAVVEVPLVEDFVREVDVEGRRITLAREPDIV
jgi:16S rRNA processing protein RimM